MAEPRTLTDSDLELFAQRQRRLGLKPDQFTTGERLDSSDFKGGLTLSADPEDSDVAPVFVPYTSMAQLKDLIGTPDSDFETGGLSDGFLSYPDPPGSDRTRTLLASKDGCEFDGNATPEEARDLRTAAESYIKGNSAKLKGWEPLLDARFTPGRIAVFTGGTFVVGPNQTVTIKPDPKDPDGIVKVNYQTIVVEPGGQFVVLAKVDFSSLIFEVKDS